MKPSSEIRGIDNDYRNNMWTAHLQQLVIM